MPRAVLPGFKAAVQANTVVGAFLCELGFRSGLLRLWTGVGDLTWKSRTFRGTGAHTCFSGVETLSQVQAQGISFSLSAIPLTTETRPRLRERSGDSKQGCLMPLARLPDWEEQLTTFLLERRDQPFVWGRNDCALYACDAVLAMTGTDLAEPFRGTYDSELGAVAAIRKFTNGGTLADVARIQAEQFGVGEIAPTFAMLGDVVLGNGVHGPTLGLCLGASSVFPGIDRIVETSTIDSLTSWRI